MLEAFLRNLWNGIKGDTKRFFREIKGKLRDSINNDDMQTTSFCTECGSKISAGSMFCMECGTKVNVSIQGQNKSTGNNKWVFILILVIALLIIVPMFNNGSRTELKDMIYLTEKEVAAMFKVDESEWEVYPNSDHPIFWCANEKVSWISLTTNSDPEHKYELWGIVVGDDYKEAIKKLEGSFEQSGTREANGTKQIAFVEKMSGNEFLLAYNDDGKVEQIMYANLSDDLASDDGITEVSKKESPTNNNIVENPTETIVNDGLINQIQYDGTAGIVQDYMDANLAFLFEVYYVRSLPTTGEIMGPNLERCTTEYFSSYQEYVDWVHDIYVDEQADYFIEQAKYFSYNGILCLNTAFDSGFEEVASPWNAYTIIVLSESNGRIEFEVSTMSHVGSVISRYGTLVDENGYWKLTGPVW